MSRPEVSAATDPWDPYIREYNRVSESVQFGRLSPEREKLFRDALGRLFRLTYQQLQPSEEWGEEDLLRPNVDQTPLEELDMLWAQKEIVAAEAVESTTGELE